MLNNIKLEKSLLWILRAGLVMTLIAPFIFINGYFFPYIVPRAIFFQITTEILLVAAVALVALFPKYLPKKSWIITGLLIFFGASALATVFSADPMKSFIGTIERSLGLFHFLHYGILFFVASVALRNIKEWLISLGIAVVSSVYVSLTFLFPVWLSTNGALPPSIMGNPTFLGAYLLIHIFFTAFIFTHVQKKWLKGLLLLAGAIQILALLATNVRGAFLGLIASAFFLLFYYAWKHIQWRTAIIGLIVIMIGSYSLVFINKSTDFVRKNSILASVTDFSYDATVKSRFSMWKMAWNGFKEKPVLGWGRENFSIVFNSHYDPAFASSGVSEGWEDRAHNVVFDELTNGGSVQLISYILLMLAVLWAVRKNPIFIALLIAYTIQNFFGVDTLNSYLPLFLFFALANFLSHSRAEEAHQKQFKPFFAYGTVALSAVLAFAALFWFTLPFAQANRSMHKALASLMENNSAAFESNYSKSKSQSGYFPSMQLELLGIMGSSILGFGQELAKANLYFQYAKPVIDDLSRWHNRLAYEQRWSFVLSQILQQSAIVSGDMNYLSRADDTLRYLLLNSPERQLFAMALRNSGRIREFFEKQSVGTQTAQ